MVRFALVKQRKISNHYGKRQYVGSNLLGRLLMELRDKGKLEYHLPDDIFDFISNLKSSGQE